MRSPKKVGRSLLEALLPSIIQQSLASLNTWSYLITELGVNKKFEFQGVISNEYFVRRDKKKEKHTWFWTWEFGTLQWKKGKLLVACYYFDIPLRILKQYELTHHYS